LATAWYALILLIFLDPRDHTSLQQIVPATVDDPMVETILRGVCTELGSALGVAIAPMAIGNFRKYGLSGSTSLAWRIGRAIALCRRQR